MTAYKTISDQKALQEFQTIGKFADNKMHPYKYWGTSTKMEDRFK